MYKKASIAFALFLIIILFSFPAGAYDFNNTQTNIIPSAADCGYVKVLTGAQSTARFGHIMESYIYCDNPDTFALVDLYDDKINIDEYNSRNFTLVKSHNVDYILETFGAFLSGKEYNYILFGRENPGMSKYVTTFALAKYDKQNMELLDVAELTNNDTVIPFNAGSASMAEYGNTVFIKTCHEMYDGHQANACFTVNTETMEGKYSVNDSYVSHSFNQFVKIDGKSLVTVELGDCSPRAVVLNRFTDGAERGRFSGECNTLNLFNIPGYNGANCTGVTVGGFEVSDTTYLTVINTVDHSKVVEYTNFTLEGLEKDERDVVVLVTTKDNKDTSCVKCVYLTDYAGKGLCASTPYIVKTGSNIFAVLWNEYEYNNKDMVQKSLKYVFVDENGNKIGNIKEFKNGLLSYDCQPVFINNSIIWYVNKTYRSERSFYCIDNVSPAHITAEYNDGYIKIKPENISRGSCIYSAIYNGSTISGFKKNVYNGEVISYKPDISFTTVKLYVLNNNLKPLCMPKELVITKGN